MAESFAKLFEYDDEQILVLKTDTEDGDPAISFTFCVLDMVATMTSVFTDTDEGEEARDKTFVDTTKEKALEVINTFRNNLQEEMQG